MRWAGLLPKVLMELRRLVEMRLGQRQLVLVVHIHSSGGGRGECEAHTSRADSVIRLKRHRVPNPPCLALTQAEEMRAPKVSCLPPPAFHLPLPHLLL